MKKCCSFIALVILTLSTNAQENYDFMEQVPLSYGFDHPRTIPAPFHPFVTQYDTYLMRYNDIVN